MISDFKCVTDTFSSVKTSLENIQTALSDAYTKAEELRTSMEETAGWQGEAKAAALAYLDLTMQYHAVLMEPVDLAVEAFQAYLDADSTFYDEWTQYQAMILI